jgi:hypothetical protein
MIEFNTLAILFVLLMIFFRPWKRTSVEKPLVIQRPKHYHLSVSPRLSCIQPFIEAIVDNITSKKDAPQNTGTQFFEVHDNQLDRPYLLAVTRREGLLYFQAAISQTSGEQLPVISEIAHRVLIRFPDDEEHATGEIILSVIEHESKLKDIQIRSLI